MIKNVIVVNDYNFINGGAGNVAISSAIGLAEKGYNVTLFTAVGNNIATSYNDNLKVVCLYQRDILSADKIKGAIQGVFNLKAKNTLNELLSLYNPHDTIIHLHAWYKALSPSIWDCLINRRFKVVVTLHDYFLICPNGGLFDYRKKKICTLSPFSIKCLFCNCDSRSYLHKLWRDIRQLYQKWQLEKMEKNNLNIIYISETNKRLVYKHLAPYVNKWYYVNNPITFASFENVDFQKNHDYLFMGRLSQEKGVLMFCKAISDLSLNGVVVGDGYLHNDVISYKNIRFTGWLSGKEKNEVVKKCKCFVFPSLWYEGAPLTILEMLSWGIPCIVPDKCAAAEEIEDGKTGFIFKSGDIESLKETLLRAEKTNLIEMHNNILTTFDRSRYSIEAHCKNLVDIYNNILK